LLCCGWKLRQAQGGCRESGEREEFHVVTRPVFEPSAVT